MLLELFKNGIGSFYSNEHLENGYITAKNRYGQDEQFNLLTLSIAGVNNKNHSFTDIYQLAEYADKVKKRCKEIWDNCYILE